MEPHTPTSPPAAPPAAVPWTDPAVVLATGLWLGRSPVAPGTVGTLGGLPLAWLILQAPGLSLQILAIVVCLIVGVPLCTRAARLLNRKDPGPVVWDEIATMPIVLLGVAADDLRRPLVWVVAFTLHRLFDISKIPPAAQLERLPEGLGIMADDVAAALYACAALHLAIYLGL